jgi:ADP-ribosylglycohydrolase
MIKMLGAIAGDVIGSIYEHRPIKTKEFPLFQDPSRFTDDTVLTVAIADAILESRSYRETLKIYTRKYPNAGYGSHFWQWAHSERQEPYNSWGNGSAMRVSPVGYAFDSIERVLEEAERSAAVTHNHPEGVKGAQAVALAVYLARQDASMDDIRSELHTRFGYDLDRRLEQIRPDYHFDVSCQGSVPEAIISFLESSDYVDAIRNAISLGGDSDTLACISGGIASAFYDGVPGSIVVQARRRLPGEFLEVIDTFNQQYSTPKT